MARWNSGKDHEVAVLAYVINRQYFSKQQEKTQKEARVEQNMELHTDLFYVRVRIKFSVKAQFLWPYLTNSHSYAIIYDVFILEEQLSMELSDMVNNMKCYNLKIIYLNFSFNFRDFIPYTCLPIQSLPQLLPTVKLENTFEKMLIFF